MPYNSVGIQHFAPNPDFHHLWLQSCNRRFRNIQVVGCRRGRVLPLVAISYVAFVHDRMILEIMCVRSLL